MSKPKILGSCLERVQRPLLGDECRDEVGGDGLEIDTELTDGDIATEQPLVHATEGT